MPAGICGVSLRGNGSSGDKAVNMADGCAIQGCDSLVRFHWFGRNQLGNGCIGQYLVFVADEELTLALSQLSNNVISVPSFQKDFGYKFTNTYIVSASWQIAFNTAASIGGFFGAICSGYLADKWGKRKALGLGCIISIGAVFMQVFARQPEVLLVGKVRRISKAKWPHLT